VSGVDWRTFGSDIGTLAGLDSFLNAFVYLGVTNARFIFGAEIASPCGAARSIAPTVSIQRKDGDPTTGQIQLGHERR
jgi:hypothetical protein